MRVQKILKIMAMALAAVSCSTERPIERCTLHNKSGSCNVIYASIINLVATPEKFNGRKVRITGYLVLEFEHAAIYLSKESSPNEAMWVNIGGESSVTNDNAKLWHAKYEKFQCLYNRERVSIEGVYNMQPTGHEFPAYPGSIEIESIESEEKNQKACK